MIDALVKPNRTGPFAAYAMAMATRRLDGRLLKFIKGDWVAGADFDVLPSGAPLVAVMNALTIGWRRWRAGAVIDSRLGLLSEGFRPPKREELGNEDSATWETDSGGDLRDPWEFINNLVLISPSAEEIYTFSTGSRGGLDAIGKLCGAHAKALAGAYPLVALDVGSYMHRDRTIGRVKFPIFAVLEFVAAAFFDDALARSRGDAPSPSRPNMLPSPNALLGPPAHDADHVGREIDDDDDIPF